MIGRLARERAETVGRLTGSERKARELARQARKALDQQLALIERRKRNGTRSVIGSTTSRNCSPPSAATSSPPSPRSEDGIEEAQKKFMASGALSSSGGNGAGGSVRRPSAEGDRAVRYAVRQLGKPYEWGAEGPETYDCSGLTSQAWAEAGTPVRRTSQEQWKRLKRVPLTELRPGDLVVYFPKATHVALYLGDGMVHRRPGRARR
ncbi:Cell wall-associated NlpC family hydrolase OS=Streptomyces violarus OX=67380 GN=FHS41_002259 PE=3 SV=1 [Streptomyces violarus]